MPSRIQGRRWRGWRQSINAIYVCRPTKWGNPHKVGISHHTAEEAVTLYRGDLIAGSLPFTIDDIRRELKGKNLVCWCKPGAPCHADVPACRGQWLSLAVQSECSTGESVLLTNPSIETCREVYRTEIKLPHPTKGLLIQYSRLDEMRCFAVLRSLEAELFSDCKRKS
jgi:hypothetical protein